VAHYLPEEPVTEPAQPVIPANPSVAEKGTEAKPHEFPPGPAWNQTHPANVGAITNLTEFPVPRIILDALVEAEYLEQRNRSDREEIKHALRRLIDVCLKDKIIAAMNRDAQRRVAAENSWGHGPR
jgi:hypothetical protein